MLVYNGKAIIPAPLVNLEKIYDRSEDGTTLSTTFNIVLRGTLLPTKGSPNSLGDFATTSDLAPENFTLDKDKFNSILRKQEHLRELFSDNGQTLEWIPSDAGGPVQAFPSTISIKFDEGIWVDRCDYQIDIISDRVYFPGQSIEDDFGEFNNLNIKSASEEIHLEETEDGTGNFILTRSISATSHRHYDENEGEQLNNEAGISPAPQDAWEFAKEWVQNKVTEDFGLESFIKQLIENRTVMGPDVDGVSPDYKPYNRVRSENIGRYNGSYSLTETWALSKSPVIEELEISQESQNPSAADGHSLINNFSVTGTITGLKSTSNDGTRFTNALTYFNSNIISGGANKYTNLINKIVEFFPDFSSGDFKRPTNHVVSKNKRTGVINFQFTFQGRPFLNHNIFEDIDITVDENHNEDVVAAIPIPGREAGPLIQNIATSPVKNRTINATFILKPKTPHWNYNDIGNIRGAVYNILNSNDHRVIPTGSQGTNWFVVTNEDNLDYIQGIYTINLVFTIKQTSGSTPISQI